MKSIPDQVYVTRDLYFTREECEIIDLLVDHNEMPSDFTIDHVISFFQENDYHLILYLSQPDDRGFQMYTVRDFSVHPEELFLLYNLFSNLADQGLNVHLFRKARSKVDHLLRMAKTFKTLIHNDLNDDTE